MDKLERRLFNCLSEDDIPSTATSNIVRNDTFNVLYIPTSVEYTLKGTSSGSYVTTYDCDRFSTDNLNYGIRPSSEVDFSNGVLMFQRCSVTNGSSYHVARLYFGFALVYAVNNVTSNIILYPEEFMGYIKIKFTSPITVKTITQNSDHPVYIDTE